MDLKEDRSDKTWLVARLAVKSAVDANGRATQDLYKTEVATLPTRAAGKLHLEAPSLYLFLSIEDEQVRGHRCTHCEVSALDLHGNSLFTTDKPQATDTRAKVQFCTSACRTY